MKILHLVQIVCLWKVFEASRNDLLPVNVSGRDVPDLSKVVEWINNFLPIMIRNVRHTNWLFLVNIYFKSKFPIVVLNIDTNGVPDLSASDPSTPLVFCIQVERPEKAVAIISQLRKYMNLYKSGKFIFISKQKPSKDLFMFLEGKSVYYSVFIHVLEDGNFEMYDSQGNIVPQNFLQLLETVEKLKVCYYESIPYTLIPAGRKGIEQVVVDLAAKYLKITIKYLKQNKSLSCGEKEGNKSIWYYLNNHSCDAVIGAWPCTEDFPYFDTIAYLTDTAILIVPKVSCSRQVGMLQLDAPLTIIVLLTFLSVKLAVFLLLRDERSIRNRNILGSAKLHVKSFIKSTFLLSTIAFFSIFQWKIYEELVRDKGHCGIKNIDELLSQKQKIGIEDIMYRDLDKRNYSLDLWEIDDDVENLALNKCHVIRDISYGYFLPRRYISANGEPIFEKVEVIKQLPIGITHFKRNNVGAKMNAALLTVLQSGISNNMDMLVAGTTRAKEIAEQIQFRSYFTPVKIEEIAWLFSVYMALLSICLIVFISEMLIWKYLKY